LKEFTNIINWNKLYENSSSFRNNNPFKFGYVEKFFNKNFYDELYQSYPKIDDSWKLNNTMFKNQYAKDVFIPEIPEQLELTNQKNDTTLSDAWNYLIQYIQTDDFLDNFSKYSGIPNLKIKEFSFLAYKQGGFQLSHAHNVGPSSLHWMAYFSKGWKKGDPGGTFMSTDEDESGIIFEPYELDNTMAIFHDAFNAWHGTRYIEKDVVRQAIGVKIEQYSSKDGWTSGTELAIKNIHNQLDEESKNSN
jgi:hypothetical protein